MAASGQEHLQVLRGHVLRSISFPLKINNNTTLTYGKLQYCYLRYRQVQPELGYVYRIVQIFYIYFKVYYTSRYRGICVGTLVNRMVVLSAAVCVTNPSRSSPDTRPINVVIGSSYRHPRRGVRAQITKIIIPKSKSTFLFFYSQSVGVQGLYVKSVGRYTRR